MPAVIGLLCILKSLKRTFVPGRLAEGVGFEPTVRSPLCDCPDGSARDRAAILVSSFEGSLFLRDLQQPDNGASCGTGLYSLRSPSCRRSRGGIGVSAIR